MSEKINFKFQEDKILKELYDYVSSTYRGHYSTNQFQSTEFIIDCGHGEGFMLGNIIKYAARYKNKGRSDDIRKARQYCTMLIALLESR